MNTPESGPLMTELRMAEKQGALRPEGLKLLETVNLMSHFMI